MRAAGRWREPARRDVGPALFPFWWLPFGLIGAGLTAWLVRRTSRPRGPAPAVEARTITL